jgi:predicted PurR-regulated permease PerM
MTEKTCNSNGTRLLISAAALVIVIWGVNQAQAALMSSLVAVFLAILGTPLVLWLQRRRVPSALAVLLTLALIISVLLVVGAFVGASLNGFTAALPAYQESIQGQAAEMTALLAKKGIRVTQAQLLEYLNPAAAMKYAAEALGGLGAALANIVLILLTVLFILLEAASFPVKLRAVLGDPSQRFPEFTRFADDIQRYMLVKTVLAAAAGLLLGSWLAVLGIDSPVLWGFLAFLLLYIPHVGSILAGIPAVSLTLVQFGPGRAALVAAGYVAVNFIIGNLVEPKLMGKKLSLSTLAVFLSLIFWGRMLGLVGAVLCIPLTMALKFAFENNKNTLWLAVLLGPAAPEKSALAGLKSGTGS